MNAIHSLARTLLLGALLCAAPALAEEAPAPAARGLTEIPDPELGLMRGRFIAVSKPYRRMRSTPVRVKRPVCCATS